MNLLATFITRDEIMEKFGISKITVWRWERDGRVPKSFRVGSKRVYDAAAVYATIRQQAKA